ncbi:MAG: type I-E CRISPR-associated protein Cas5/CasD [Enterovibrio sp.]
MTDPYLLLWLEGPLQSWGHDSRFGVRETLPFPTLSGVLGLVCAALGAGGEQRELLAELSAGDMQVYSFSRQDKSGSPSPRALVLRDFHMVGSGFDDKDPWQTLLIPKTRDGKKAVGGGAKMTYRDYLQECAFAVLLQVPQNRIETIANALQQPVWDLCLGRKNCAPTEFIYQGQFATAQQALDSANQLAQTKRRALEFILLTGSHDEGELLTLNDVPLQFGEKKRYSLREVTLIYPDDELQ